ncbi:MAG: hypothetical protein KF847_19045 [Pirellulales bacterium]|nr:hypothetical protein [Pirellulales bacterium]
MTGAPTDLLAECEAHGIRLTVAGDGGLAIDAPQDALTPDLLGRLKAHKGELLALLRPAPNAAPALPVATRDAPATPTEPVCRCGGTAWRDVPIHGGRSTRRDCAGCRRFIGFPVWYGKDALHYEQ